MKFSEVLAQTLAWLQREGRISYRALKREFDLDDEYLEDLKEELIEAKRLAIDENGKVLVWKGEGGNGETAKRGNGEAEEVSSQLSVVRPQPLATRPQPLAERRQLTVLFCDLVGSTALSEQLDPEELREVVQAYQKTCTTVLQRYDGHVAQHLGDGLLVYFGYPQAHEDDAQRAVRAGLEIVEASRRQGTEDGERIRRQPLQVRIGIHTGLVVIGEIGSSEKREILALGETPNIAARLQSLAEPDSVVVSAVTQRLVAGLFEYQDLGPQVLKGITIPLSLYRVVRESAAQKGTMMKCFHCQAELRRGTTTFTDSRNGYVLVLQAVPAWVCPQCGEPLFEEAAVEGIQVVLKTLDEQVQKLHQAA